MVLLSRRRVLLKLLNRLRRKSVRSSRLRSAEARAAPYTRITHASSHSWLKLLLCFSQVARVLSGKKERFLLRAQALQAACELTNRVNISERAGSNYFARLHRGSGTMLQRSAAGQLQSKGCFANETMLWVSLELLRSTYSTCLTKLRSATECVFTQRKC